MTRRSTIALLTALLLLVSVVLVLIDRRSTAGLTTVEAKSQNRPSTEAQTHVVDDRGQGQTSIHRRGTQATVPTQPGAAPDAAVSLVEQIIMEPDLALTQTTLGQTWTVDDYLKATENADAVDGATAFAAYEFARSCIGEPRSDDQFEFKLEQYNQWVQDNPRRVSAERLDRAMDRLQEDFLRCEPFADTDLVDTASGWLMLAADLGYLPAQVRFYQELPALLRETQSRVFREPQYLDLHRSKSVEYLNQALMSGHPRSFLAMAIALTDGVVFDEDAIAAHAYLIAADLAAAGRDTQITEMLAQSVAQLSPGDLSVALSWGRNLCWDYCQLEQPQELN